MSTDNQAVDEAVEEAESTTKDGKIDKRTLKRGPKQRFWVVFGLRGQNVVSDMIAWPPPKEDGTTNEPRPDKESAEACEKAFKDKHRLKAMASFGPVYEVKDKAAPENQRAAVTLTTKDILRKTSKSYEGVFRGWKVYGNGLKAVTDAKGESFKDNELIAPLFDVPVNPDEKPSKPRIKDNEALKLSDLEDAQEL
jgi:hypothetical protein